MSIAHPARRLPISAYAALGGGHTGALVGTDGAVDWLCLPDLDGTPTLSRLLDAERGGHFSLAPAMPATARRRYLPGTNVLETVWATVDGEVAVTDALVGGPGRPERERLLVRRIDGLDGAVDVAWIVAPRFGDGATPPEGHERLERGLRIVGAGPGVTLGVEGASWDGEAAHGSFSVARGERRTLTLGTGSPPPAPEQADAALDDTGSAWRTWSEGLSYDGPWRDTVLRSALALRLLVQESTGAMAAAATLGLPEQPGGSRNYDYRYCWLRDSSFVVDALASLGDRHTPAAYLAWMAGAIGQTLPVLQPYYRLDGGTRAPQRESTLAGYGGARPVLFGNRAFSQRQLGNAGDLLQCCALFIGHGGVLPDRLSDHLARIADHVARSWRKEDAGIWETSPNRQHTWSKMACWVALARAADLADAGHLAGDPARWRAEAERVREHVEAHHFDADRGAYRAVADERGLDAAVLLAVLMDYPADPGRWHGTLDAIASELGAGALLYRTTALREQEQTFLPCAFWRAHALTRLGRLDEADEALDALMGLVNDVGLLSEEAAPDGTAWGNVPQALTHAALINAAVTYHEQRSST